MKSNEIWKPIKGFEGLYEVSNLGNIRKIVGKNQFGKYKLFKEIKPYKNEKGYLRVGLSKNNKRIIKKLHRLVAETFLVNPNNYPCANHIDSNRTNNEVENLEFCTHKQNIQHAYKNHRFDNMKKINSEIMKRNKPVLKRWEYVKNS